MTVARIENLVVTRSRDGVAVVDGIGFAVRPGEVVALMGASGSGKTTTALTLLGHVRPGLEVRSGSVRTQECDPFDPTHTMRLRRRIVSFLGQDPASALNPARRIGRQLAETVRIRSGLQGDEVAAEIRRLLARMRLPTDAGFLRRFPHQLSGGQARRVAFTRALAGSPALLVLDEPTAGLDPAVAEDVRGLIGEALTGCAAVLVSHDRATVRALAHHVLVLERGKVHDAGSPHEVLAPRPATTPLPSTSDHEGGLVISGLRAGHGKQAVLHGIDLRVAAGQCVAVVGPSGSGKSTLARCVVGLHRRHAGTMSLDGVALAPAAARRRADQRRAVQLVAQDSAGALNPHETVRSALTRPMRARSVEQAEREAERLLGRVRLPVTFLDRYPGSLSGGERQRVNLARALACDPTVLVCDEVTSALDAGTADAVLDLLDELRATLRLSVVLITHDLSEVVRCASHVTVLGGGRVVECGPVSEVLTDPRHPATRALVEHAPSITTTEG
ncbi:ABC transporter ATP-binding protein [Saccharopolyspora spinosa]|uniref:Peptide/nickel transport system ATP-binding protein n=1 Tax=Saccharopolyspora spinosa TaxID=60894 RepID=A0A2N3Y0M0_SACSN|nr:ATP-binding cassette domain-containing protein [Saccharopolyspora spinosa]PKW16468.1 peptide/nickel transport system ATP-binding protein [Saccharopolyspora spinosa]